MGLGVMVVHDKNGLAAVYNGDLKNGKADGVGTLKFRSEETGGFDQYIGGFEDGKPMGDGIFYSSEGWSFQAFFNGRFDSGDRHKRDRRRHMHHHRPHPRPHRRF
jgi:hypothetical protein